MPAVVSSSSRSRFAACTLRAGIVALSFTAALLVASSTARAAGYEVGENTTLSLARGGTGVASKRDPSALYFNPALLPRADGVQLLTDVNLIDFNLSFQRDDLVYQQNRQTRRTSFGEVENSAPPFPVPSAALTFDFGLENLTAGIGVFGPHAYGERCFGKWNGGTCKPDSDGAARHMLVHSFLIELYLSAGIGYRFELPAGSLSLGATGIAAYQNNDFKLVINSEISPSPPWEEDPANEATFRAKNLTDWKPSGIFGLAYEYEGLLLAVSYRPPIHWESTGTARVDFPQSLDDIGANLSDDKVAFRAWQAGSLRFGVGYEQGEHPGLPERPRFSIELNGTWEDWSRVERFTLDPKGDVNASELPDSAQPALRLNTFFQEKNWRDTFSLRAGASWGALSWLTVHGGALLETPAQTNAHTNLDFASWERYAGSLGASFHPWDFVDIKLAFMHIRSPDRQVDDGFVFQKIPTSSCTGPDYRSPACERQGRPPGNPQNEGKWSAHYNIGSLGATFHFD